MKIVVFRRRWVTVVGCAVAAVAMFGVVTNPAAVGAAATERPTADLCRPGGRKGEEGGTDL